MTSKKELIQLPKEVQKIRVYFTNLFEDSIHINDPVFVYDLVAILAMRAHISHKKVSKRCAQSPALTFVRSLEDALKEWEGDRRKLSPLFKTYLYGDLFSVAAERAVYFMRRDQLRGISESAL